MKKYIALFLVVVGYRSLVSGMHRIAKPPEQPDIFFYLRKQRETLLAVRSWHRQGYDISSENKRDLMQFTSELAQRLATLCAEDGWVASLSLYERGWIKVTWEEICNLSIRISFEFQISLEEIIRITLPLQLPEAMQPVQLLLESLERQNKREGNPEQ
jgi:hypothetical protein